MHTYHRREIILNEGISDIANDMFEALKKLLVGLKNIVGLIIRKAKIPEICDVLVNILRNIPLINKLIPNKDDDETYLRRTLSNITVGDGIAIATDTITNVTNFIWDHLPVSTNFKNDIILPVFNYNERKTFMQTLYKLMIDAEIPTKYANAYLVVLTMKIPLYNLLYVFKTFWSKDLKKSNPTIEDKAHPWTSGDPVYNEDGLQETEQELLKKVQKFIEIKKRAVSDLDESRKLTWQIIKDSLLAILIPIVLPTVNGCRFLLGTSPDNPIISSIDSFMRLIVMLYYYYFLITSLILTSLAVKNEESINPSIDKEANKKVISMEDADELIDDEK